ncbi:femAB family protein [bacterium BMS3Abin04]|nr:femAB family protein [bacterium BMS3Abin04]
MQISINNYSTEKWKEFISKFPAHNIFHSPEMAKVFDLSEGFEQYSIFVHVDNKILAFVPATLVKIKSPVPGKYSNRLILYASPLYEYSDQGEKAILIALEKAKDIAKKKSLFLEIRNSEKFPADKSGLDFSTYEYIPYQNYLVALSSGCDNIWSSLNSSTRNHIRKGEKRGMVVREMREEEITSTIDLLENLYRSKNVPFLNKTVFTNAYNELKNKGYIRIIVADYNSKIIGARISLNYGSTVYDWYAAADSEFKNFYSNDALVWNTIQWGCDNNYKVFDFGGGAIKGQYYGPAKFKEKYKGELVEFGRYRFTPNKVIYFFANQIYNLITKK